MGILIHLAKRWVAGEYLEDAIKRAKSANSRGIYGIINHVGEHFEDTIQIEASANEYSRLLVAIKNEQIDSAISIKPSQLGLMQDKETCLKTVEPLVKKAQDHGTFVWIDMEGSLHTQQIIDIYKYIYGKHKNLGIAIQSYLFRTPDDLNELAALGAKIRLCKGAYKEPANIALKNHDEISQAFSDQLSQLFIKGGAELIAVATHDDNLIKLAKELNKTYPREFEFQMLMGVRDRLKENLVKEGYKVSGYIPYGKGWLPYYVRRLNEQKRNIKTGFISLFKQD
jgi:proline dehydrogenase